MNALWMLEHHGGCDLQQAWQQGAEEEREACAKLADNAATIYFAETMGRNAASDVALTLAEAIRARGSRAQEE